MNREFVLPFQAGNNKHGLVQRLSKLLICLVLAWMRQSPKLALKSNQWNGLVVFMVHIVNFFWSFYSHKCIIAYVAHGTYSNKVNMGDCCVRKSVNHHDWQSNKLHWKDKITHWDLRGVANSPMYTEKKLDFSLGSSLSASLMNHKLHQYIIYSFLTYKKPFLSQQKCLGTITKTLMIMNPLG